MMKSSLIYKTFLIATTFLFTFASEKVAAQVSLTQDQPLSFGSFSFINMSSVVEINLNPNGSYTHSNVVFTSIPTEGQYTLTGGDPGAMYSLSVETSETLTGIGPGNFTLDNIVAFPETGNFDGFGDTQVYLGGRLRSAGGGVQYKNDTYTENTSITISY